MGQTLSRRLAGRLEKSMQRSRQLMKEDALRDVADKQRMAPSQFTDPNAVHGGFQRGQGPNELFKEVEKETAYLEQHADQTKNNMELPPDLIQFLKDAGPLERKVDKERTSPRLHQQLQDDIQEEQPDPHRKLRDMPIMENVDFSTSRTTNFSTVEDESVDSQRGLSQENIYSLLLDSNGNAGGDINLESFLSEKSNALSEKDRKEQLELMRHTLQYLAVPVLMKESNDNVIGTHEDRVSHLERMYKLKLVPENHIRLIISAQEEEDDDKSKTEEQN